MPESSMDFLAQKRSMKLRGKLFFFDQPEVMGIINLTPDSFYDGGKLPYISAVLRQAEAMLKDGALFLDIGGYSSRPGADEVGLEEELKRVIEPLSAIRREFPEAYLSIDTFRSRVAKEAVVAGADIVNDISAGDGDDAMFDTIASLDVPYILMHMQGKPQNMQDNPTYGNVVKEVLAYLAAKQSQLKEKGLTDLIVDPGFGFGKSLEHNYQLLSRLHLFKSLRCPVLVGLSRKSMINKLLKTKPSAALNGTTVLHTLALEQGCQLLRVHDVKEAKEAVVLHSYYQSVAK